MTCPAQALPASSFVDNSYTASSQNLHIPCPLGTCQYKEQQGVGDNVDNRNCSGARCEGGRLHLAVLHHNLQLASLFLYKGLVVLYNVGVIQSCQDPNFVPCLQSNRIVTICPALNEFLSAT